MSPARRSSSPRPSVRQGRPRRSLLMRTCRGAMQCARRRLSRRTRTSSACRVRVMRCSACRLSCRVRLRRSTQSRRPRRWLLGDLLRARHPWSWTRRLPAAARRDAARGACAARVARLSLRLCRQRCLPWPRWTRSFRNSRLRRRRMGSPPMRRPWGTNRCPRGGSCSRALTTGPHQEPRQRQRQRQRQDFICNLQTLEVVKVNSIFGSQCRATHIHIHR